MSVFICPLCKTRDKWGLETRPSGSRYYSCHGNGCHWICEEHQALEFGLVSVKESVLSIAVAANGVATTLGVRALDQPVSLRHQLADAAEDLERMADKLRIVASYLLHRENVAAKEAAENSGS